MTDISDRVSRMDRHENDRIAAIVKEQVAEVVKGMFPAGAQTTDLSGLARAITAQANQSSSMTPETISPFLPLAREQMAPFGAGIPLVPAGIDPVTGGRKRPGPRISEFPVGVNLNLRDRVVPFSVLRDVAEIDVIRSLIRTRKAHLTSLEWNIVVSPEAIVEVMAATGETSPGRAAKLAHTKYADDIARLRSFWKKPDRGQDLDFPTWFDMLQEEQLVVDAATVYPRPTRGGMSAYSFEIVSGDTIKPLLNNRGAVPTPPQAAYQQILYGFPRGEFTASADDVGEEFAADQLVYRPRYRRARSAYGYSSVEVALSIADLYLKRIGWLRAEYTHGALPTTLGTMTGVAPGGGDYTPDQLMALETALNEVMSGQTEARHALKLMPRGLELHPMAETAERYKAELDELLIKLLCMCFGVMPTEIGFAPKTGGAKQHSEGEENSTYRKSIRPDVVWYQSMFTDLSCRFLGMPPALEFSFLGWQQEDQAELAAMDIERVKAALMTVNETRAGQGLPLLDIPQADMVFMQTSTGALPLSSVPMGTSIPGAQVEAPGEAPPAPGVPGTPDTPAHAAPAAAPSAPDTPASSPAKAAEADSFIRFAGKRAGNWRDFRFDHHDAATAATLNKLGRAGDVETIRDVLGKGRARLDRAGLVARHAPKLASAARALFPAPEVIAAEWVRHNTHKAAADRRRDAKALLGRLQQSTVPLSQAATNLTRDAYAAGVTQGLDQLDWLDDPQEPDESGPHGNRLVNTLSRLPVDVLAGYVTGRMVTALVNNTDPTDALTAVSVDLGEWAGTQADAMVTDPLTQGKVATFERNFVSHMRLTASAGDCEFCTGYDGRIMTADDEGGLPPLHAHCSCDVEALEPVSQDKAVMPDKNAIAAAVAQAKALPDDGDSDHVAPPWDRKGLPALDDVDWQDAALTKVKLAKLRASTKRLKRENLIWHLKHPGEARYRTPFSPYPLVIDDGDDLVIVDGHHRLAALLMLGETKAAANLLDVKS